MTLSQCQSVTLCQGRRPWVKVSDLESRSGTYNQSKVIIDQSRSLRPSLSIKGHYRSKSVPLSIIIDQRSLSIKVRSIHTVHIVGGAPCTQYIQYKGHYRSKSVPQSVIIDQRSLSIKVRPSVHHYQSKVIINQSPSLRPSLSIKGLHQSKSIPPSVIIDQR